MSALKSTHRGMRMRTQWGAILLMLPFACGPAVESVTALDATTHEQHFPLSSGKHAGIDCNACHGAFDTFTQFTCLGCHLQPGTDPIHTAVQGYRYDSAACYACHPKGVGVDHTPFFPIETGTVHGGIACATCHVDPTNRKVFDCISCHTSAKTDPVHGNVSGYQHTSAGCYGCHPDGVAIVNHTPFFPIGPGTRHSGIACTTCHVDPTNRNVFDCISCHTSGSTDRHHSGVSGYQHTSAACYRCHPSGRTP